MFQRSPNLEKILAYLCGQYFAGKGQLIKEYSIATDVLGLLLERVAGREHRVHMPGQQKPPLRIWPNPQDQMLAVFD